MLISMISIWQRGLTSILFKASKCKCFKVQKLIEIDRKIGYAVKEYIFPKYKLGKLTLYRKVKVPRSFKIL